ncbi:MAG: ABC transporter substrate-binding protein [Alphaproteobacteria bacterium]|nr:ABC transporter substrate-binding protein [Alphaproteobacteria bacterium]
MQRRDFLTGAAGFAAGAAAGYAAASPKAGPAQPATVRSLRMVTSWPRDFPLFAASAERLAVRIAQSSGGGLAVEVRHAGEAVPPYEAFDAVSTGVAQLYHGCEAFWRAKNPAFQFFASIPYGLGAAEFASWLAHGEGQTLWDELAQGFDVKPFLAGHTGIHAGGWYAREIRSAADLKGLRLRMPDLGGEILARLGAAIVPIPAGDVVEALKSKIIDGAEWYGPAIDLAFGLHRTARFYYVPAAVDPGMALSCGINRGLWDTLDEGARAAIADACAAEAEHTHGAFLAENARAFETLVREHGIQPRRLPDPVVRAIGRMAETVVREMAEADAAARKIHASYMGFRARAVAWSQVSEWAYLGQRDQYR